MAKRTKTTDRTVRLFKIEHLLYQNKNGLLVEELAHLCGVSTRTIYRDLAALESYVGLPIWGKGSRRGILKDHYLPPIRFSLPEAMRVFLAARLMLHYSNRYDPDTASTFTKLNSVLPRNLGYHVQKTLEWMQHLKADDHYQDTLHTLVEAWINQRMVKVRYQTLGEKTAKERYIDPYFIEPAATGHSSYVVGYCHLAKEIRVFKIERIKSVEITDRLCLVPPDFDANLYLSSGWGIVSGGEAEVIKLRFAPQVAPIMEEAIYHPSQVTEKQDDGSLLMTLHVMNTYELCSWILSWGDQVEVLEPRDLRQEIIKAAKAMLKVYEKVAI